MDERSAYIALNMMEKVGPVTVRSLKDALGSAAAVFDADKDDLRRVRGVGRDIVEAIVANRGSVDWAGELARTDQLGARIVTAVDEEYPPPLREIHDPPLALYVRGALQSRDKQAIAVVGTRRPTHYGRDAAGRLAYQLGQAGFVVVSGLALGIDTAAHEGALKAQARTLAVIGGGLDVVYPPSNLGLADRIAAQGAVLSEYPLGCQPDKTTFPVRNRIVSGLSMGVLVVEAGRQSGAMHTARQAAEQGRPVFAVPGRIDSPASQGCHDLIKQGARLTECLDDVLQEYEFLLPAHALTAAAKASVVRVALTADEERIVESLGQGEMDVDSLIRACGLDAATIASLLLGLEMKRLIRMLPGRIVELRRE
ncbi:MAG: DNA-processing protein DprA [Verrucomicrobiota bacterium]|nr:DNA-processing protein DprA [Verrucomicrobiota bacterium]